MNDKEYIVVVDSGSGFYRSYTLRDISKYYRPLLFITNKDVTWEQEYVDHSIKVDKYTVTGLMEIVNEFRKTNKVAGVLTYHEDITDIVAEVAERLGFRGISQFSGPAVRNKYLMRTQLQKEGASVPKFRLIGKVEEAVEFANEIGYPVILKPTLGSVSMGVIRADNEKQLLKYFPHTYQISKDKFNSETFLIEEYIGGVEVSVESVIYNGVVNVITVTDKILGKEPFFEEIGHLVPSQLPEDLIKQIKEVAIKGNEALKIQNGITHTEVKCQPGRLPAIMEIGGRIGGDFIPKLVHLATGVNLNEALVDVILGRDPSIEWKEHNVSTVRFIVPEQAGLLIGLDKALETLKNANLAEFGFTAEVGCRLALPPEMYFTRLGYYIIKEKTIDSLKAKLAHIQSNLEIDIL